MLAELLPGWPDMCLAAIDLCYGVSAQGGREEKTILNREGKSFEMEKLSLVFRCFLKSSFICCLLKDTTTE